MTKKATEPSFDGLNEIWLTRFFANPRWYPLAWISYGTYLVHPFVLFGLIHFYRVWVSTADFGGTELILFYLVVMGLSSLVAAALFELVELPMLHWGARLSRASKQRMRQRLHSETS
jgi:peptidoglycan/LPS O-acetylase OafA/YrhL